MSLSDIVLHIVLIVFVGPAFGFNPRAIEDFICFGNPTDTLVPHPEECGSYFICDGGLAKKNTCHPGINFNPILSQCDPNYNDCNGPHGPDTGGATSSSQNTTDTSTSPTLPTARPHTNSTSNETAQQQSCPLIDTPELTFLPSIEYCDQFYLCYYGKPMRFDCSGGYYWSQSKKACVQPHQSECQVRQNEVITVQHLSHIEYFSHHTDTQSDISIESAMPDTRPPILSASQGLREFLLL